MLDGCPGVPGADHQITWRGARRVHVSLLPIPPGSPPNLVSYSLSMAEKRTPSQRRIVMQVWLIGAAFSALGLILTVATGLPPTAAGGWVAFLIICLWSAWSAHRRREGSSDRG